MYLNAHSYYSLRYGTLSPEKLVAMAVEKGLTTLALTDINTVSGVFEFVKLCRENGIQPVVGAEFRNHQDLAYVVLARNTAGFAEINRHLSDYLLAGKDFPLRAPRFDQAWVMYPLGQLDRLGELAEGEFVGVRPQEVTQLWRYRRKLRPGQVVIRQPVTYATKTDFRSTTPP